MDYVKKLKETVVRLEDTLNKKVADFERDYPGIDPFDVTDSNGRPILLDSLNTLANTMSTLAMIEYDPRSSRTRGNPPRWGRVREGEGI